MIFKTFAVLSFGGAVMASVITTPQTTTVTQLTTATATSSATSIRTTSFCPRPTSHYRPTTYCRPDEWCPDRKCDRELERERELARRRELELIREFDWELQRERDRRCYDKKDDCKWTVTKTCVIDKTPCCLYAWPCPTNTAIFVTSTSILVVQPTAVVRQDRVDVVPDRIDVAPNRVDVAPNRVDVAPNRVDVAPEVRPACTPCTSYATAVTRPALVCTTMVFCDIAGQTPNCRHDHDHSIEVIAALALRDGGDVFINGERVVLKAAALDKKAHGEDLGDSLPSPTVTGLNANDATPAAGLTAVGGLFMLAAAFLFA